MNAVGVKKFIEKHPDVIRKIFPTKEEATIFGTELKERLLFQDETERNQPVKEMLLDYIDVLEEQREGTVIS